MKVRGCLVALCLLILHCPTAYGQTPRKDDRPAEWEYKQLYNPSDEILNRYAKDGWEIVAAPGGGNDSGGFFWVILKRSKSHSLFGTPPPEFPTPAPLPLNQKPKCKLTLAQAPAIRGLRLGMTGEELFAIFPANGGEEFDRVQKLKSAELHPNFGYASFQFNPSNYAIKDRFIGVDSISLGLFDRKVVYISASYSNTPKFDSAGQLMEIITRQFGLPEFKTWPDYNEYLEYWNTHSLYCDGFTFQVFAGRNSISISLTDPAYKKIADERKKDDLARKLGELKF